MRSVLHALLIALLVTGCCCPSRRTGLCRSTGPGPSEALGDRCAGLSLHVPITTDARELQNGDAITLRGVRGDRARLEEGGTYCIWGTYTLRAAPMADLMLWSSGETEAGISERSTTARGTGEFRLRFKIVKGGALHVSFYPSGGGNSLGGVYFDNPTSVNLRLQAGK
jgi:hypothetical protein